MRQTSEADKEEAVRSFGGPARCPALEELIAGPGLAGLGPRSRPSRLPLEELEGKLASFFQQEQVPAAARPLLRAALFLWHDHLDASHEISQGLPNSDGGFLHGIMHRREPDYGNAKYWFHRIGLHPCFPLILDRARAAAATFPSSRFLQRCAASKEWDPFALVDACEENAILPAESPEVQALEKVQEIEMRTLLDHFLPGR